MTLHLLALLSVLSIPSAAVAAEPEPESRPPSDAGESDAPPEERTLGSRTERVLATADRDVPPEFSIWKNDEIGAFIKPVIQISSLLVGYLPQTDRQNTELANRVSTLLLARIGFEGQLFDFVSFRSVFERNLGFTIARNGPVGTSVWEGTASWQARENYIRLSKWGLSLTAGIVPDPASLDYISENILDAFGMDPYVRDPLLVSGFNQGQSILLRYQLEGFAAGFGFTGGNPLVSSLSFGFGGDVSRLGDLFNVPLRALSNGVPGSDIQMNLFTPSLSLEGTFLGIEGGIKTAAQVYRIDIDVTQDEETRLHGYNLRATGRLGFFDNFLQLYATGTVRENDRIDLDDTTELEDEAYVGAVAAGGFDLDFRKLGWGPIGLGGNYYYVYQRIQPDAEDGKDNDSMTHYINLGLTYWLWNDVVSAGFRWGRSMQEASTRTVPFSTTDSLILSLRLII